MLCGINLLMTKTKPRFSNTFTQFSQENHNLIGFAVKSFQKAWRRSKVFPWMSIIWGFVWCFTFSPSWRGKVWKSNMWFLTFYVLISPNLVFSYFQGPVDPRILEFLLWFLLLNAWMGKKSSGFRLSSTSAVTNSKRRPPQSSKKI